MKRITIRDYTVIPPFGEPARDLRILNKPLWVLQRDLLSKHCRGALELDSLSDLPTAQEELFVYRDNLFFNQELIDTFVAAARASGHACQIAFSPDDRAITRHALQLQDGIRMDEQHGVYVADMFYYPHGGAEQPQPLLIDTLPREMGYYHIPSYMAEKGDLVYNIPLRVFLSIENWVHIFLANSPFGVFAMGRAHEQLVEESWREKIAVSLTTLWNKINPLVPRWRNHFLASERLVKVGKNCSIDPTAIIHGPTVIGNNVTIGAGVTITNSIIGNNVTVMQGCQVMLSVVSDRCYLPFNTSLFMTTLMDNSMVAQLSCLQMCVIGRNTFIGANTIFTDFNLVQDPIRTLHKGQLTQVDTPVLGSAVGHNTKIGSGFVIHPGRMIGSNTVMLYNDPHTAIMRNVNLSEHEPTDAEAYNGEPEQRVFLWPRPYDPRTRTFLDGDEDAPAFFEALQMPVLHNTSAGLTRRLS